MSMAGVRMYRVSDAIDDNQPIVVAKATSEVVNGHNGVFDRPFREISDPVRYRSRTEAIFGFWRGPFQRRNAARLTLHCPNASVRLRRHSRGSLSRGELWPAVLHRAYVVPVTRAA